MQTTQHSLGRENDVLTTQQLLKVVTQVRALDKTMPIQLFHVYLDIVANPGTSIVDIAERLDMTVAATARNVSALCKENWLRRPGLDLIYKQDDPVEHRRKTLHLTERGKRVWTLIKGI